MCGLLRKDCMLYHISSCLYSCGSGKTLAFGIPLIHRILRLKEERATELANQDASSDDGSAESTNQDDESGDDEIRLASIVAADGEGN